MSAFGLYLREARRACGMSQRELGATIRVSTAYICDIEAGRRRPPSLDAVAAMATALGASASRMISLALGERHSEEEISILRAYFKGET